MKPNVKKSGITVLALGAAMTGIARAQDAPRIVLNGDPLHTQVAPITRDGRVLVPLRDIFEALGAFVRYNAADRTITARRSGTVVHMSLGSRRAEVNGDRVRLDVPANTVYGSTMVPLRFVSEALGATVNYNADRGVVHINDRSGRYHGGDHRDRDYHDGDRHDGDHHDDHDGDHHDGDR